MARRVDGRWRIVEMDLWDRDAIDLVGPAFIEITADGRGSFRFIAVEGFIDARHVDLDGCPAAESVGTDTTKGTTSQVEGGCVWTRMARCVVASSSTLVTTLASALSPQTCPSNAGLTPSARVT